ncbi:MULTISPECIES: hypothetical protein [Bacillota]|uniref:hypothetical protein n=1 Tax=Bacillota TaxID=1239 RepID=UPI0039EF2064
MTKNVIAGQEDIFSMFGIVDEYAEQKKQEEEERARKAEELRKQVENKKAATSAENKGTEKDLFEVNQDTVIRYFGESIEIISYFTSEELAEGLLVKKKDGETERRPLDGELLRKRMEKDFPELVKDMTEMVYLKDKNIVIPVMKAKKKGNCRETSSQEGVSFPVPFNVLSQFISLARLYAEQSLEIHADIYKSATGHFFLDVPAQRVHKYWCEVSESSYDIAERVEDAIKVLEIHSHHCMAPLPSTQDNESERLPGMIYAIVGGLQKPLPDITIRCFISEDEGHKPVPFHLVFEDPFKSLPAFDMSKVEVVVA